MDRGKRARSPEPEDNLGGPGLDALLGELPRATPLQTRWIAGVPYPERIVADDEGLETTVREFGPAYIGFHDATAFRKYIGDMDAALLRVITAGHPHLAYSIGHAFFKELERTHVIRNAAVAYSGWSDDLHSFTRYSNLLKTGLVLPGVPLQTANTPTQKQVTQNTQPQRVGIEHARWDQANPFVRGPATRPPRNAQHGTWQHGAVDRYTTVDYELETGEQGTAPRSIFAPRNTQ